MGKLTVCILLLACSCTTRARTRSLSGIDGDGGGSSGFGEPDLGSTANDPLYSSEVADLAVTQSLGDLAFVSGCAPGETPASCDSPLADNAGCTGSEVCGNGMDDNCNGQIDEGCTCTPGDVQRCFIGPPGKRGKGACTDGTQTCGGAAEFVHWGDCEGSIGPGPEVCDKLDNDCDGCADDGLCCGATLDCPGPGDSRIAPVAPYTDKQLQGGQFFKGTATKWTWTVEGGPCDRLFASSDFTPASSPPKQSFTLTNAGQQNATVHFTLSGDYTVTLTVVDTHGQTSTCKWVQHVVGPGVRFELCWDHQGTKAQGGADLDLHVHKLDGATPAMATKWFTNASGADNAHDCFFSNCTAPSFFLSGAANFGYSNTTPNNNCKGSKYGSIWDTLGYCHNPRLDLDNVSDVGVPENANIDNPTSNDSFRAMVHYYGQGGSTSSTTVNEHPIVNIYCGGTLKATYGQKPDQLPDGFNFGSGRDSNGNGVGMIWRVADVQATGADANGNTTCTITPLHSPDTGMGYWVVTDKNNTNMSY